MIEMTSVKPYLLRGVYDWVIDNQLTPHVLVDASAPDVRVPPSAVAGGRVVLNIGLSATHELVIGNDYLLFSARFSGVRHDVRVPISAILAIYARENGRGITFAEEEHGNSPPGPDVPAPTSPNKRQLRLVKS